MKRTQIALALLAGLGFSGVAQAALQDRGGGLIYDTDLNITWLKDANYAKTSGYDADGLMTWFGANTWANGLDYYDSVRNQTLSNWHLPTTPTVDGGCSGQQNLFGFGTVSSGTGCTGSQLGHLFYNELGGAAFNYLPTVHNANFALFLNVANGTNADKYWSSSPYAPNPNLEAWAFYGWGNQTQINKSFNNAAWAVMDGDVGPAPAAIPEPETYAMLLAGLGLLGFVARRRKQQDAA